MRNVPRGFDFHCHIDLHPDPAALVDRCEREQVVVLAVTTTPLAWPQNRTWTEESEYVHAAAGLHPELVGERYAEACLLEQQIAKSRFVGEIGLDGGPQHKGSYEKQKDVFARSLVASQTAGGRVVTIHSRRAARDVVDLIRKHVDSTDVLCILHWYSGSLLDAQRAVEVGCFFSVNTAMALSDRGRKLITAIPRDRLLTETDSPFMTINGRQAEPADVVSTVKLLAELYDEPVEKMFLELVANARRVFGFAGIDLP